ncbi:Peroxidase 52 [Acorus gramineus]|uniref:Peroxidase n=1 Tax=Acorus gramineus TaxID=55184 RepID=A0AAV9ANB8_ACOGR|nr:Peroxidase 52 [Acorus gramineus]
MASSTNVPSFSSLSLFLITFLLAKPSPTWSLSTDFYKNSCPGALSAIKQTIDSALAKERRMGASLLRLHFHDCFVNGCDGSILLDNTSTIDSEKFANANNNSARGFNVVDDIKAAVDKVCGGPVVSCADILAVAARDSVVAVLLGRRDSRTANRMAANNDIPAPTMNLSALITSFKNVGLDSKDLVALGGGHTLGFARCTSFRDRAYNDTNIDPAFVKALRGSCPRRGGDNRLQSLDQTPAKFDVNYFKDLVGLKGLLHSDQQLFSGGLTDAIVKRYSDDYGAFAADFVKSMVRMGNISPLTGGQGEVRKNCRRIN